MRAPAIRVYYTGGPVDHGQEVCLIGPYPDADTRDQEILRLASLAGLTDRGDTSLTSPWMFDAEHADRDDADLWAPSHAVTAATDGLARGALIAEPERVLNLFRDPSEFARGWYSVDRDGEWVDVPARPDTAPLFELDDLVVAADGATTTVGGLEAPKIYEEPSRYTISVLPPDDPWRRHYVIDVVRHSFICDNWSVQHLGFWADRDGVWEPMSGGDTVPDHIFPLSEALALARRLAPTVETNERTALAVLNLPREGRRG